MPAELTPPGKHQNNMCPLVLEVHHPAYERLQKYVTGGFFVKTGQNWNGEEIYASAIRVPHKSALAEEAIAHFAAEAKEKVASNQARLVRYEKIKGKFLTQMKVSLIAAITHKSKAFR